MGRLVDAKTQKDESNGRRGKLAVWLMHQLHDLHAEVSMYGPNRVERYGYLIPPVNATLGYGMKELVRHPGFLPDHHGDILMPGAMKLPPSYTVVPNNQVRNGDIIVADLKEFTKRVEISNQVQEAARSIAAYFGKK